MSKNAKIILAVIGIIAVIAVVAVIAIKPDDYEQSGNSNRSGKKSAGSAETAPDFTVKLSNGKKFTLSDHKDEVVLLNLWATWCPPCVGELPAFEQLKNDNIDGLVIVAVNCAEEKSTVDSFIDENGYTFNIAYDESGSVIKLYPTDGIPYTLIIADGEVKKTFLGAPSDPYGEYKSAVEEYLKK
ncbi:MAG: TlpA family protein disulfide reductase [Clostridia bacterium]|nr:TlpA family protein disulfide reductase [Clostridia bacterium]